MKDEKKDLWLTIITYVVINLFIFGIGFGAGILYPLTYTAVPETARHLWYGDTLEHYLTVEHIIGFVVTVVLAGLFNTYLIVVSTPDNKNSKKAKRE